MDDSDLSGLDLDAAREYIFAYAVDIKRYDKEIASARSELELWSSRAKLAEGKGLSDLAAQARAKADEVTSRIQAMEAEQAELRAKVGRMRQQLPLIRARERSIDPDRLLAELQLMTGELLCDRPGSGQSQTSATAERELANLEAATAAESALEALKKKMDGGGRKADGEPPAGGDSAGG